jgi:hypothetical protein
MRLSSLFLALTVVSASLNPALCPTPAAAQQAPPSYPCNGNVNIVRISDIKPGMMDTFLKAIAAQQAWYKNAGTPDQIGVMRIMEQDPATKTWSISETQAITTHIMPTKRSGGPRPDQAGWDAFVKMFSDSSTIKTQYMTCMPATSGGSTMSGASISGASIQ